VVSAAEAARYRAGHSVARVWGRGHTLFDLELDLHHVVDDLAAGDALHDQQGVGVDPVKLPEAA
jgi:hypothetical protein